MSGRNFSGSRVIQKSRSSVDVPAAAVPEGLKL